MTNEEAVRRLEIERSVLDLEKELMYSEGYSTGCQDATEAFLKNGKGE